MKRFLKKGSFNNFQILAAFLIPTIVYLIFSVDWTERFKYLDYYYRSCRKIAKNGVDYELIILGRNLTEKQKKKAFESNFGFCMNTAPDFYEDISYDDWIKQELKRGINLHIPP